MRADRRRFRPCLEGLEDRFLLASSLLSTNGQLATVVNNDPIPGTTLTAVAVPITQILPGPGAGSAALHNNLVATFTDSNFFGLNNYSAIIYWGDSVS